MYSRLLRVPQSGSFFLFGPRGTGKTSWVAAEPALEGSIYLDLLESELFAELLASPQRLAAMIPKQHSGFVVIDEVQKVPALLDEVHRLIETRKLRFALTGSSARKLKREGANLLAGRARTMEMFPLTVSELGDSLDLQHALLFGGLPTVWVESDPVVYLKSYVTTYLREEIQQEGLTRNLPAFTRFLEAASFSQAGVLNVSAVARECQVNRKLAESYFAVLDDLLLACRLPIFAKRAHRKMVARPKFMFFDVGVYRAVRPKGPLDRPEEIEGVAWETLLFQELRALNSYSDMGYEIFYWRTHGGLEVDFILYGERGIKAFEVKRSDRLRGRDLRGPKAFLSDYPTAEVYVLYGGARELDEDGVRVLPMEMGLRMLPGLLS